MLIAGILSVISGMYVVSSDKGNIASIIFLAPPGETKYAQVPKALINLCISTLSIVVFNIFQPGNIAKAISGEPIGSRISNSS